MRRMLMVSTVVAAAALLLAGCGGDGDSGGEGGGGGGTATLTTIDNAFQPASLTVSAGAQLELKNDGQAEHNFSIEGTDVSQDVDAGETAAFSVDVEAGDYTMFCKYHRAIGMVGTVTVQ